MREMSVKSFRLQGIHMAKSKLVGQKLISAGDDFTLEFPTLHYSFLINNIDVTVDLTRLMHFRCDVAQNKASRQQQIVKYARAFKKEMSLGATSSTLYNSFTKFKGYLIWCDDKEIFPFCESTWKNYRNYLWELVLAGRSSLPIWQRPNGQILGLKERTANYIVSTIEQALVWCEENVNQWGKQLRPFKNGKPKSYEAYSDKELPIILNRLSTYFFQLAIPLLSDDLPTKINIEILEHNFDVPINSTNTKGKAKQASLNYDTAFNQAMSCAYYLLSYFTAFNSSQLIELRHPIEWQQDKTTEYYKLTAYKRRANKEVISFVGGEIHKKSIQFMETLIALSLKYNKTSNGLFVYWLDGASNPRGISSTLLSNSQISSQLMLLSDRATACLPYLLELHKSFIATGINGYIEFTDHKIVDRKLTKQKKVINRFFSRRIVILSILLLYAIIHAHPKNKQKKVKLNGSVLPLTVIQNGQDIKATIRDVDGTSVEVYIENKYQQFLEDIVNFALTRQNISSTKPSYLLPLGLTRQTLQWEGIIPNTNYLSDYGIAPGEFFVSLRSSQFRETAAKLARRKTNRTELQVSQILNNQYMTVIKHYSEGNHYDNQLILAQGLSVIEAVSQGHAIKQAKDIVAIESDMKVIKFEELTFNKATLNGIGVACTDNKSIREDEPYNSPCFDYESCIKCKYAKLIDDVEPLYRLLSFLECMEESWLYYPDRFTQNIGKSIELYRKVIAENIPKSTLEAAQLKLDSAGRHMLWDDLELASMGYKGTTS